MNLRTTGLVNQNINAYLWRVGNYKPVYNSKITILQSTRP